MKAMQLLGDLSLFDGENATVATDTGLVTFRAEGVMYDGADCPDLVEYVPSLRMTGAAQMGDLLLPTWIDVYARDNG
jgi:phosphate transport system substrate-binding protein